MPCSPCLRFLILSVFLAGTAWSQSTPTQALNEQLRAQFEAQQRAAYQARQIGRQVQTRRLQPPCAVPDSWYPLRTCKVSTSAAECGKGFNAWPTHDLCCASGTGAFADGCTNFDLVSKKGCWIPGKFHPFTTCAFTQNVTRCEMNWGRWDTEEECCAPGAAHGQGCMAPKACYIPTSWEPKRECGVVEDAETCARGWGTFLSEEACCEKGAAFNEGCSEDPRYSNLKEQSELLVDEDDMEVVSFDSP